MTPEFSAHLTSQLDDIRAAGLYKEERLIGSPQGPAVELADGTSAVNMCANNYLGLGNHPDVVAAAKNALDRWGYGLASVRFICGTQSLHRQLEKAISKFLGTADTILYAACFDANGGLFEPLLTAEDAIISDALNHASIIDGIRLCKAKRFRYKNRDTTDLETQLKAARADGARHILIATDGAFSMDGTIAPLAEICALAERYDAQVMIDDCHSTGFLGETGRGTPEHTGTTGKVDVITGTLGKALGGASGGFTSGPQEVIDILRQRSRPYLFSNTLAPPIAAASLKVLELLTASTGLRDRLADNTRYYTDRLRDAGFDIGQAGQHPIVPVMLGDAKLAQEVARRLLDRGVYAIGFFFPVVPRDTARIRTQVSAAHTREHLDTAVDAFAAIKSELGF